MPTNAQRVRSAMIAVTGGTGFIRRCQIKHILPFKGLEWTVEKYE